MDKVAGLSPEQAYAAISAMYESNKSMYMGGYLVGFMADCILLGIVSHQFLHWWQYSKAEDRLIVKLLVFFSVTTSLAISIYLTVWMFHIFVDGFGNYMVFLEIQWMSWWFFLDVVVRVPVQMFFAERAWRMTGRSLWFAATILVLFVAAFGTGLAVKLLITTPSAARVVKPLILVWLGIEISSDVLTTMTIGICLYRSRTGWSGTDRLIGRLLRLILETQFPPTVFATVFLVLVVAHPEGSLTACFTCSPKVYAVCLLAVLNARHALRKDLSAEQTYTKGNSYILRGMRGANTGINVTTETYTHVTRGEYPDTRSTNRDVKRYELDVTEETDEGGSTHKEAEGDLEGNTHNLGYGSVDRLTAEEGDDKRARFGV